MIGYENNFPDHHETYGASPEDLERQQADDLKRAATIHAYEESINRPYQDRWIKTEAGKQNLNTDTVLRNYPEAQQTDLIPAFRQYADKCRKYLRAGNEIDLATSGKIPHKNRIMLREDTPRILRDIGCDNLPMIHTQRHLFDELTDKNPSNPHFHGLTTGQIKEVPELLENPVAVFMNLNRETGIVCLLDKKDNDQVPIILAFLPNGEGIWEGKRIESNVILTIFGKDGIRLMLENALDKGKLLYVNQQKLVRLLPSSAHQLRRSYKSLNGIIRQYRPGNQEVDTSQAKDAFFRELNERYNDTTALSRQERPERGESRRKKGAR